MTKNETTKVNWLKHLSGNCDCYKEATKATATKKMDRVSVERMDKMDKMDKTTCNQCDESACICATCRCCGYQDVPSLGWSDGRTLCPACEVGPHEWCPRPGGGGRAIS